MAREGYLPVLNDSIELVSIPAAGGLPPTAFAGIGAVIPGEARILGTRVGLGFGEIAGICVATAAAPGVVQAVLTIEQSVDGAAWDQVDPFNVILAGVNVAFAIKIIGRYVRAVFTVPVGEVYSIRFGATLRPMSGP